MNIIILYSSNAGLKSYRDNLGVKISKNITVLDKQVKYLNSVFKDAPITIINKSANKKNEEIIYHNVSFIDNNLFDNTNCLYNIGLSEIKSPLLIVPGNILFGTTFLKNFNKRASSIWVMKEYNEIGCVINDNYVSNMMFGLDNHWSGVVYFAGKEVELLKDIISKDHINKWHLFEGINWIIENGGKFKVIKHQNKVKIFHRNKNA